MCRLLRLPAGAVLRPALILYALTRQWPASQWAKNALLPTKYRARIEALNTEPKKAAGPDATAAIPLRCPIFTKKLSS